MGFTIKESGVRLTFEQVWRGEETTWQAEVRSPGSGSLDDISCELVSVEPDCDKRQSLPGGR